MQPTTTPRAMRPSSYLLAALVVGLALASMNRANAISGTANGVNVSYNLAAGAETLIAVPVSNQPVHVMAVVETLGVRGVCFVDVLRVPDFLMWTGKNSTGVDGGSNTSGFSSTNETKIASVNFQADVLLEVQNPSSFAVSNNSPDARAGNVTMAW